MTTTERKLSNLQRHDFAKDSQSFGRLEIILVTVKSTDNRELIRVMSKQTSQALPSQSPAVDSEKPEVLLKDMLHRIARHIRDRVQQ